MPADNGERDRLADLYPEERRNPHCVLATPECFDRFVDLCEGFPHHHCHPSLLHAYVRQQIPEYDQLYAAHPDVPPLFHVDETIAQLAPPGSPTQIFISNHLMCLKFDPPANVPPLHPNAPPGPTVNYVRERTAFVHRQANEWVVHWAETWRVCIVPAMQDRSRRLGLKTTCTPTARHFEVAAMTSSLELMSFALTCNVSIRFVELHGQHALKMANILQRPKPTRIPLDQLQIPSGTFGMDVGVDYHPRVTQASAHRPVRSLSLARSVAKDILVLGIVPPHQFAHVYAVRATRLNIAVDDFATIVEQLNLDVSNIGECFNSISQALMDYIDVHGVGFYGGGPGPNEYRNLGKGAGRGCGVKEKRKTLVAAGVVTTKAPNCEVTLRYPLEMGLQGEMLDTLMDNGYLVDDKIPVVQQYARLLPCLLLKKIVEEKLPRLVDRLDSHWILYDPEAAGVLVTDLSTARREDHLTDIVSAALERPPPLASSSPGEPDFRPQTLPPQMSPAFAPFEHSSPANIVPPFDLSASESTPAPFKASPSTVNRSRLPTSSPPTSPMSAPSATAPRPRHLSSDRVRCPSPDVHDYAPSSSPYSHSSTPHSASSPLGPDRIAHTTAFEPEDLGLAEVDRFDAFDEQHDVVMKDGGSLSEDQDNVEAKKADSTQEGGGIGGVDPQTTHGGPPFARLRVDGDGDSKMKETVATGNGSMSTAEREEGESPEQLEEGEPGEEEDMEISGGDESPEPTICGAARETSTTAVKPPTSEVLLAGYTSPTQPASDAFAHTALPSSHLPSLPPSSPFSGRPASPPTTSSFVLPTMSHAGQELSSLPPTPFSRIFDTSLCAQNVDTAPSASYVETPPASSPARHGPPSPGMLSSKDDASTDRPEEQPSRPKKRSRFDVPPASKDINSSSTRASGFGVRAASYAPDGSPTPSDSWSRPADLAAHRDTSQSTSRSTRASSRQYDDRSRSSRSDIVCSARRFDPDFSSSRPTQTSVHASAIHDSSVYDAYTPPFRFASPSQQTKYAWQHHGQTQITSGAPAGTAAPPPISTMGLTALKRTFEQGHGGSLERCLAAVGRVQEELGLSTRIRCPFPPCNQESASPEEYDQHISQEGCDRRAVWACTYPTCNKIYERKESAWWHAGFHRKEQKQYYAKCPDCAEVLRSADYPRHLVLSHGYYAPASTACVQDLVWLW